jgi:hypothetical protein
MKKGQIYYERDNFPMKYDDFTTKTPHFLIKNTHFHIKNHHFHLKNTHFPMKKRTSGGPAASFGRNLLVPAKKRTKSGIFGPFSSIFSVFNASRMNFHI